MKERELGPWRRHPDESGVSSNALADADRERMGHRLLLGFDNGAGKMIRSASTMNTVYNFLVSCGWEERNLYATSHPDEPTKLSFDLEYEHAKEKHREVWKRVAGERRPTPEEFLRLFLRDFELFISDRGLELHWARLAVSKAHDGEIKISFHLISLDFFVEGRDREAFYGRSRNNRPWGLIPNDKHLGKWCPCLDISLGTNYRHLRTLYSTKNGQRRWLEVVTELDGIQFFSDPDPFRTFAAHTWTDVPDDCSTKLEVPVTGKRPAGAAPAPRRGNRSERGVELFRLLGLEESFNNIKEVEVDRSKYPSTIAAFSAKMVVTPCPWCNKKETHDNHFFFPIRIAFGEMRVSAFNCNGHDTCRGCQDLAFIQDRYQAARGAWAAARATALGEDASLPIPVAAREARSVVRDTVVKLKIHNDPGRVWATARAADDAADDGGSGEGME